MKTFGPDLLGRRLALVTGAGRGNGRAIALGLAAHGADVIATDIDGAAADDCAAAIRVLGRHAYSARLDVTDISACANLAGRMRRTAGAVSILVNNAGIIIRETIDAQNAHDHWRRVLDVNLNGVFNVTHAFLADLRETRGAVINVGSIASFVGVANTLGYSPSKGGVKLFTQALARELGGDGVRVNAIAPGVIETPMTQGTRDDPARLAGFLGRIPAGRIGQPDELVGPVVFLASDLASYVNGAILTVDGGFLAV